MHFIRIFGGQAGVAAMTILISSREKFHSNLLGLHVEAGDWLTGERMRMLTAALLPASAGPEEAQSRAAAILGEQVRAQAYTMAVADGFILIGWMVVFYLLMMMFLRPAKLSFKDIRSMQ